MVTAAIMVVLLWAALTSELLISVNLFLRESFSPVLYLVSATATAMLISLIMLLHWRPRAQERNRGDPRPTETKHHEHRSPAQLLMTAFRRFP